MATRRKQEPVASTASVVQVQSSLLDVEALRQIVEIVEGSDVTRLQWRRGPERLVIVRGHPPVQPAAVNYSVPAPAPPAAVTAAPVEPAPRLAPPALPAAAPPPPDKPGAAVNSPFVGTFYRTPAPDQPSFVEVGTQVRKGQVLCIIEAMKLMNEIESEVAGRVAEIFVQNGQPVEFGQPLFRIEPS